MSGIRIIDLTMGLAGPVATRFLAEQGADVIKVEPPSGDVLRGGAAFSTWNRSKRSVTLDLGRQVDVETLGKLVGTADVLLHSFGQERAAALGIDDHQMAERCPHLVVLSVRGYPNGHPDADRSGYDILVQARSGVMDEVVGNRVGPIFLRYPLPSWSTVYLVVTGILTRLIVRGRTGAGGAVHTSLLQGTMAVLNTLWNRVEFPTEMLTSKAPVPKGSESFGLAMFECADGLWLQLTFGVTQHPTVIEAVADLGFEPVQVVNSSPTPRDIEILRAVFLRCTRSEWLDILQSGDASAGPQESLGAVFSDPQAMVNEYTVDVVDPIWGEVRQSLAPFSIEPISAVVRPAPALGQHNAELEELLEHRVERPVSPTRPEVNLRYPLQGLRVLDFGNWIAGPLATMMLADLGAEVIKVEPLGGDQMRPLEVMFLGASRGKRSISLDLKQDSSREVVRRLLASADIVHHNVRGPAARRLGIDYETVRQINPQVIFTHVSSYGSVGQKEDWPGYDPIAQAASGWPVESARVGTKPMWYRFMMMDHQAAMASLVPTLLALYRRDITGEGSRVTSSLLGVAVESNSGTMRLADGSIAPCPRIDEDQTGLGDHYRIFATVDDQWIAVVTRGEAEASSLRRLVGHGADSDLASAIRRWKATDLIEALDAAEIPNEPVRLDRESGFFADEVDGPSGLVANFRHYLYGEVEQPGALWHFNDMELKLDVAPPALGQHSQEVLADLGFSQAEIDEMVRMQVVKQFDPSVLDSRAAPTDARAVQNDKE